MTISIVMIDRIERLEFQISFQEKLQRVMLEGESREIYIHICVNDITTFHFMTVTYKFISYKVVVEQEKERGRGRGREHI